MDNMNLFEENTTPVISKLTQEDREKINICRKLRTLGNLSRIKLDLTSHTKNQSRNTHLFGFMEACGLTPLQVVKQYLCNVQPFMIERFETQQLSDDVLCVLDLSYSVSIYVKVNKKQFDECIIPFHENNKGGLVKQNNRRVGAEKCLILCDSAEDSTVVGDLSYVAFSVSRGFRVFDFVMSGECVQAGVWLVSYSVVEAYVLEWCNQRLEEFSIGCGGKPIRLTSILGISFTSYGDYLLNDISFLIDCVVGFEGNVLRADSMFLLESKIEELLKLENGNDLLDALYGRFDGVSRPAVKKVITAIRGLTGRYLDEV